MLWIHEGKSVKRGAATSNVSGITNSMLPTMRSEIKRTIEMLKRCTSPEMGQQTNGKTRYDDWTKGRDGGCGMRQKRESRGAYIKRRRLSGRLENRFLYLLGHNRMMVASFRLCGSASRWALQSTEMPSIQKTRNRSG